MCRSWSSWRSCLGTGRCCPRPCASTSGRVASVHLVDLGGQPVEALPAPVLAGEIVHQIEDEKIDVLCISALPPSALMHARYLCKRLAHGGARPAAVIGMWGEAADVGELSKRVG